jgi:hypothetical protein
LGGEEEEEEVRELDEKEEEQIGKLKSDEGNKRTIDDVFDAIFSQHVRVVGVIKVA